MNIQELKTQIVSALLYANCKIDENQINIYECGNPHQFQKLNRNEMAVYIFTYQGQCLKVGKVNKNSNARFCSQHYYPDSSNSNLAKSMLTDVLFKSNETLEKDVGKWIKNNTKRINIVLDGELGVFVLNFVESFTQLFLKPRYEGFQSQIK